MTFELVNTSVPKGLRDRIGWANVVATEGMPPGLEPVLEELSAFDLEPGRPGSVEEIDWCHRIVTVQGRPYTVLSRIAACGADWTGRPNRIAHHLVLEVSDRTRAGPAWVLARYAGFATSVPGVEWRPAGPTIPQGQLGPRRPSGWEAAGFDPGWAGVVAGTLLDGGGATTYLVLPSLANALGLLEDVFALLPEERRWTVTFSTRFARVPSATRCQLRCVREGASGLAVLLAEPGCRKVVVKPGVSAGDSAAAEAARAGNEIKATQRTGPVRVEPRLLDTPVHVTRQTGRPSGTNDESVAGAASRADRRSGSDPPVPRLGTRAGSFAVSRPGRAMNAVDVFLFLWAIACIVASVVILVLDRT